MHGILQQHPVPKNFDWRVIGLMLPGTLSWKHSVLHHDKIRKRADGLAHSWGQECSNWGACARGSNAAVPSCLHRTGSHMHTLC